MPQTERLWLKFCTGFLSRFWKACLFDFRVLEVLLIPQAARSWSETAWNRPYHIHQAFISFAKYVTLLIQVFFCESRQHPAGILRSSGSTPDAWQSGAANSQSSSEGYAMVCLQKFKNTSIDWLEEFIYVFIPKKNIFQICGFVGANFETYPADTRLMFIAESS